MLDDTLTLTWSTGWHRGQCSQAELRPQQPACSRSSYLNILWDSYMEQQKQEGNGRTLGKLTIFEESSDLLDPVRRELAEIIVVAVLGIIGADGNDLVILLSLSQESQ